MEEQMKHLEFIQNAIAHLNGNSFQIKSWSITIEAAVIALSISTTRAEFLIVGVAPIILFWVIDAYCLRQERKYRGLYNDVAEIGTTLVRPFDMDTSIYKGGYYAFWTTFWAKTIWIVYLVQIAFMVAAHCFVKSTPVP